MPRARRGAVSPPASRPASPADPTGAGTPRRPQFFDRLRRCAAVPLLVLAALAAPLTTAQAETVIWSATLTVGRLQSLTGTARDVWGYSANDGYGTLDDTDFTIGSTTYTVPALRNIRQTPPNRVVLTLDTALGNDDIQNLVLWIGSSSSFKLSEATVTRHPGCVGRLLRCGAAGAGPRQPDLPGGRSLAADQHAAAGPHQGLHMAFMADGYLNVVWAPDNDQGEEGIDVWDVSDPRSPRLVRRWNNADTQGVPQQHGFGLWNRDGQIVLAVHLRAGMRFYDVTGRRTWCGWSSLGVEPDAEDPGVVLGATSAIEPHRVSGRLYVLKRM